VDSLDDLDESMFARCASEGQAAASVASRHEAEALRAELRRLAREFGLHVGTLHRDDRVILVRGDDMPWDDTDAQVTETFPRLVDG
jgi:hypothetical protein